MKLPRIESLIISVFFLCVGLWALSTCNDRRAELARRVRDVDDEEREERPIRRDTIVVTPKPVAPAQPGGAAPSQPVASSPAAQPSDAATPKPVAAAPKPVAAAPKPTLSNNTPATAPKTGGATLYVTIEGLKMRKEPGLKSESVAKLALYEPVTFLNQKTEWTQEISLGYEKATDHWVKVRNKAGKEGWVFGAGVHYYKMKRKGVLE